MTSTKKEYDEKYSWWVNELESLGISANKTNEFNNIKEVSSLANNIKSRCCFRTTKLFTTHGLV